MFSCNPLNAARNDPMKEMKTRKTLVKPLPSDSDLNEYLQKEPISHSVSDSSPHLTPSDNDILAREYWLNNPACQLLKQHILAESDQKQLVTQKERYTELAFKSFDDIAPLLSKTLLSDDSIIELESDDVTPLPSKAFLSSNDSVMEPELDEPGQHAVPSKTLLSNDSVTELESDNVTPRPSNIALLPSNITPLPSKALPSGNDSVTEPESEPTTPKPIAPKLDQKWFTTPSPPPPGSIYWKYFAQEEEACFYDHSRTDESFQAVWELKHKLDMSLDDKF
ncbi:uncharacterized protein BJ212DRAFT_1303143 [Suillus subaureus]|uniref:Uncharacterized protein n=1 Tax=Suillus subaureus TaxID=48587 RepID=A0A9P7E0W5_9AGAM|nr:uncharacterized protein BJ212DRAFT_1303143 [Suillus subaureus]KAG1808273.1 hypothetical protein BJ212DRAFT_1303143 [Suillus subaureus]